MKSLFHQITILTVFFIFHFNISFAQEIVWEKTIGGGDIDNLMSMHHTTDGGYICGGSSNSKISFEKNENTIGYGDYWIVKLDSLGRIQWQNTIGGNGNVGEYLSSISNCKLGGYICGGFSNSNSSVDKSENSIGGWDYWVIKLDSVGNIEWENTIGGTAGGNGDRMYGVTQAYDGSFYCGGFSESDSSADKSENKMGPSDFWIIKLDSAGNILYENTIGGNWTDACLSIAATPDGGCICGGNSASDISGDKTENSFGGGDFWVVRLDPQLNIQWQKTLGGDQTDGLNVIICTNDGGFICGGQSNSGISGTKTEPCLGDYDYWIVKLDSIGNIQWQQTIGGGSSDILTSIIQTADGGYVCGGQSNSSVSGNKTESCKGKYDYWILKLDSSGNIEWQNTIGGTELDFLNCIDTTNDGNYICGGWSKSDISGDKSINHHSVATDAPDYWIAKITEKFCSITGKLYVDLNSNSLQDFGEESLNNKKVTEISTGKFDFTDENGYYRIVLFDTGTYVIDPDPSVSYYNSNPISQSSVFVNMPQTDSLNDFAFQPSGTINDLCLTITPLGQFRSGFNAFYEINYANYGTTTINGDVIFLLDSNITFVSSNIAPSSVSQDSIVWNTGMLSPYQTGIIMVTVHIDSGIPIGTLIYPTVHIEPIAGDANPQCNTDSWEVYTTGSLDPNDILVRPEELTPSQLAAQPFLEYIIRFQNTGNDTAFNVKIINPIDTTKLEANTIELLTSSHPVNMNYIHSKNFEFDFDNILLPDKNTNKRKSHGFIRYRIKPKTNIIAGDSITNNALIYFDFNNHVITNNAITKITVPNSYNNISVSDCNSYLSPSGNYLWTTSGIYIDSLPNAAGYDSIITINLTIISLDTSVTTNNPSLTSNATNASYQWMYCDSALIPGSTNQTFMATANGSFAVIVSQNGCSDTSLCYTVTGVGIAENNASDEIIVKPNPANHSITIQFIQPASINGQLLIADPFGRVVYQSEEINLHSGNDEIIIDISSFAGGLYFVQLDAGKQVYRTKFVKQ